MPARLAMQEKGEPGIFLGQRRKHSQGQKPVRENLLLVSGLVLLAVAASMVIGTVLS